MILILCVVVNWLIISHHLVTFRPVTLVEPGCFISVSNFLRGCHDEYIGVLIVEDLAALAVYIFSIKLKHLFTHSNVS